MSSFLTSPSWQAITTLLPTCPSHWNEGCALLPPCPVLKDRWTRLKTLPFCQLVASEVYYIKWCNEMQGHLKPLFFWNSLILKMTLLSSWKKSWMACPVVCRVSPVTSPGCCPGFSPFHQSVENIELLFVINPVVPQWVFFIFLPQSF